MKINPQLKYYLIFMVFAGFFLQNQTLRAQDSFTVDSVSWQKEVDKCSFSKKTQVELEEVDYSQRVSSGRNFNFDGLSTSFQIFAYLFITVIVLLLIYALIQSGAFKRNRSIKTQGEWLNKIEQIEEDLENKDLNYFIEQALKEKAYNVAIRLQYLLAIQQLNESNFIIWKKQKTNGEYQRELKDTVFFIDFKKATLTFEYIWYSNNDFTDSKLLEYYNSIERNVENILKGINQEQDG
jgi:hypothetical protein